MGALPYFVPILLLSLCVSQLFSGGAAHNITAILEGEKDFSDFNNYLSQTKLDDEINSRQTITVLALNNAAMSAITGQQYSLAVIKNVLSLLVLLDYFDGPKLHAINNGTTLITTLYQTTGSASDNVGFVNITDLKGGKVAFGSGAPGSKLISNYVKSIYEKPYNISVIEISSAIVSPEILSAPAPSGSNVNLTALLVKAGCKTFASLITSTGVIKTYESAVDNGLTIFAPTDEAFKAVGTPDISKLTNADTISLLLYHAIGSYYPTGALKSQKDPLTTLASKSAGKFDLTVSTAGDEVKLKTGVDSSRIAQTLLDSTPLCIFTVDHLLLPTELFGKSPSPAPAPGPKAKTSPSPSPDVQKAPSPGPVSPGPVSPSPKAASPPAPPSEESPTGSPADAPGSDSANVKSMGAGEKAPEFIKAVATASATVIVAALLS
ncbi:fasciclin-like arabinogalactan protein 8 [Malania oleifera]|uniref:fasciclin-like arabinogalactan protein 8 n=1 Tax=Malania oleifera TaxID=397392 RepID=UPI0025AE48E0|nr:fasciclin-like arabinogalactan protein 8 [Malania oleifera]